MSANDTFEVPPEESTIAAISDAHTMPVPSTPNNPVMEPVSSATITRPSLNRTFPVVDGPPPARPVRDRQKTMVVESPIFAEIRSLFVEPKNGPDGATVAELERKICAIVQRLEADSTRKIVEAKREHEGNIISYRHIVPFYQNKLRAVLDQVENNSRGESGADNRSNALRGELELLHKQLDEKQTEYDKLSGYYAQLRKVVEQQRNEYEELLQRFGEEQKRYQVLENVYDNLKTKAQDNINRLQGELAQKDTDHERNTLSLRLKGRQMESEITSLKQELGLRQKRLDELTEICETLMKHYNENDDQMSVSGTDDA